MKTTLVKPVGHIMAEMKSQQMATISRMLGWTAEQYCNHQSDEYEMFLKRMFFGFPSEMLNEVRYSPIMRGFWNNEWLQRNERDFILFAKQMLFEGIEVNEKGMLVEVRASDDSKAAVYDEYLFIHSHRQLINDKNFLAQYNHVLGLIRKENR